jgi:hypothetical protein
MVEIVLGFQTNGDFFCSVCVLVVRGNRRFFKSKHPQEPESMTHRMIILTYHSKSRLEKDPQEMRRLFHLRSNKRRNHRLSKWWTTYQILFWLWILFHSEEIDRVDIQKVHSVSKQRHQLTINRH